MGFIKDFLRELKTTVKNAEEQKYSAEFGDNTIELTEQEKEILNSINDATSYIENKVVDYSDVQSAKKYMKETYKTEVNEEIASKKAKAKASGMKKKTDNEKEIQE